MHRFLRGIGIAAGAGALPLVLGFGICGPSFEPPPEPRGCTTPAAMGVVTALELGAADLPFSPSSRATPMLGGQGSDMLGYRIGVQATEPIDCIALSGGNLVVNPNRDWYVTDPIWRIVSGPSSIGVVAEGYGMRVERVMSAMGGPLDAGAAIDGAAIDGAAIDGAAIDAPP